MKKKIYKCCWNCGNAVTAACKTEEEAFSFKATKRFCCASYPVSKYALNPYKKRWCGQFEEKQHPIFRVIDRNEAEKLELIAPKEQIEYWEKEKNKWKN